MKYISLFSGIEAATEAWAPLGWTAVAYAEIEPFPIEVLANHYPGVPNLGDVTKVDWSKYEGQADVVVGGSPCFVADTLILTRHGLIPISEVKDGDEVLTHRNRWRPVITTMARESETYIVKGQGHHGIETTESHPFYARCARREWIPGSKKVGPPFWRRVPESPQWIKAKNLKGLFWASPATIPDSDPNLDCEEQLSLFDGGFTPKLMWVLGAWLGDGWARITRKQAHLILCAAHKEADDVEARIRAGNFSPWRSEMRTSVRFGFGNRSLTEWVIANFGSGAKKKKIPTWLLGAPEKLRRAFYEGYLFADGATVYQSRGGGRVHTFTTISKQIAIGVRLLANTLGLSSSICFSKRPETCVIEGRKVNQNHTYQIRVYEKARSAFFKDGMVWGKVRSVGATGNRVEVFNIEVEEDNSYVADGITVHNCQSFSVAGKRAGMDDPRGVLAFEYLRTVAAVRPRWVVFENVPGILTSWTDEESRAPSKESRDVIDAARNLAIKAGFDLWADFGAEEFEEVDQTNDFDQIVSALEELGYQWAFRTIDAQHFGVPQRRQRMFLVGYLGGLGRSGDSSANMGAKADAKAVQDAEGLSCVPFAVLFNRKSLLGHPPKSKKTRKDVAPTISARTKGGGGLGTDFDIDGGLIATDVAPTLGVGSGGSCGHSYRQKGNENVLIAFTCKDHGQDASEDVAPTLRAMQHKGSTPNAGGQVAIAFDCKAGGKTGFAIGENAGAVRGEGHGGGHAAVCQPMIFEPRFARNDRGAPEDVCPPLKAQSGRTGKGDSAPCVAYTLHGSDKTVSTATETTIAGTVRTKPPGSIENSSTTAVQQGMQVRRLTPRETERLQGFKDGHTRIPWRGKPPENCPDGPRYRAVGNSMAVPVVRWIGERIAMVESIINQQSGKDRES